MKPLTASEKEAVLQLAEYEVAKVAASKRCISEHTEKNQIKAVMAKLEVTTQIGLMKELFRLIYGIEFNLQDARQMWAVFFLALFLSTMAEIDLLTCRTIRVRRNEVEFYMAA